MKRLPQVGCMVLVTLVLLMASHAHAESLSEAIDEVLTTHPQVKAQTYTRLVRNQELRQAKSGYFPTLDVLAGAGASEHRKPENESLEPWETAITLRQNLFEGFGTQNEVDRQEFRVQAAAYKLQSVSEYLALQACSAYLEVLRREQLKEVAQKNLDTHLRIMAQVKQRSDSGAGSRADTEQVAARLALAQSNLVVAEANLLDAYSVYVSIVGHMPENLSRPVPPDDVLPASLEDAIQLAVSKNPTLNSAVSDLKARKQQYEASKAPYYPRVDLELEQKWDDEISRSDDESERDEFSAMVWVRFNIFNGWKDDSRKAESLQLVNEAGEIRNNTERQVVESLKLSWRAFKSNRDRIGLLEKRIASSESTARAYAQQFEIGRRTLLDVLNTEAEAINARASLVDADFDLLMAKYRILNGMGALVRSFGLEWPEESRIDVQTVAGAD